MAIGKSGTIKCDQGDKYGYFGVEIDWSETYDAETNTSTVTCQEYITYYSIGIGGATRAHCTIDGTASDAYVNGITHFPEQPPYRRLVATFTKSGIAHNADGSKSITVAASFNFWLQSENYGYVDTLTATATIELYKIPRNPPEVKIAVWDAMNYANTYGGYVRNRSKLHIVVTASSADGANISDYRIVADGKTYTEADVTTDVLSGVGSLPITATVTDDRGMLTTQTVYITVLDYTAPKISAVKAYRSDSAGNASSGGAYITVQFSAQITSLNAANTANYTVAYKKTGVADYPPATTLLTGNYNPINAAWIFPADTASSYDIRLNAVDAFQAVSAVTVGLSVSKLISMLKSNNGLALGKVAEEEDCLDIAWGRLKLGGVDITPADHVVAWGTSGIWSYRKWASGAAECWGTVSGTGPICYIDYPFGCTDPIFLTGAPNSCGFAVDFTDRGPHFDMRFFYPSTGAFVPDGTYVSQFVHILGKWK